MNDSERDTFVLFYWSELQTPKWKYSIDLSNAFDNAALRFWDHDYRTVLLACYDVYKHGLPEHLIGLFDVPSMILFPAGRKHDFVIYSDSEARTRSLMEFVERHASTSITLTDKSHLPSRFAKPQSPGIIPMH